MPDCTLRSVLRRQTKELARLCLLCRRQLYETLKGVISGEQPPKGAPGKLLGSPGSHEASGPHPSTSFTWSCGLAAFHRVVGWEVVCGKPAPHGPAQKHGQSDLTAPILPFTLAKCKLTERLKQATCNGLTGAYKELRWNTTERGRATQTRTEVSRVIFLPLFSPPLPFYVCSSSTG